MFIHLKDIRILLKRFINNLFFNIYYMTKIILLNVIIIGLEIPLLLIPYGGMLLLFGYLFLYATHALFLPNSIFNLFVILITLIISIIFIVFLTYFPFHLFSSTDIRRTRFRNLIRWHISSDQKESKINAIEVLIFIYGIIIISIFIGQSILFFNLLPQ